MTQMEQDRSESTSNKSKSSPHLLNTCCLAGMASKSHKRLPLLLRTTLPPGCYPHYFFPLNCRCGNGGSERVNHLLAITQVGRARARFQALAVGAPHPQRSLKCSSPLSIGQSESGFKQQVGVGVEAEKPDPSFPCIVPRGHLVTHPQKLPSVLGE